MGTYKNTIYLPAISESGWDDEMNLNLTRLAELVVGTLVSPAQITADQNDYSPTGMADATVLRLTSDAARSITGLATGGNDRVVRVWNVGAFTITLVHESTLSAAANRFTVPSYVGGPSSNLTLNPNASVILVYDNTSLRWRAQVQQSDTIAVPGPILLSVDTNLYRSAADTLKTDDALHVVGLLKAMGSLSADQQVLVTSSITSTAVGVQNDWTPTGLSTTAVVRWTGASALTLTGISGGAAGRVLVLRNNTASNAITLKHEDAGSLAANRFNLPGALQMDVFSEQQVILMHDGSKWTVLSASGSKPSGAYATSVGNGVDTDFTVTHGLGFEDVVVTVYDNATNLEVDAEVEHPNTTQVIVRFVDVPTSNQYRVVVLAGGATGPTGPQGPAGADGAAGASTGAHLYLYSIVA